MRRTFLAIGLTAAAAMTAFSQRVETGATSQSSSSTTASANQAGRTLDIQSGARLAAELQSTIDVRKAKVGDEVVLKTTQALKSQGHTVVNKGARLIGHVTEVEQKTQANGTSRIGLLFDRLDTGSMEFPISATITSITRSKANVRADDQEVFGSEANAGSTSTVRSSSSSQSGGGLVSGVVNTTTSTVGSVVSATTGAVGAVAHATTRTVTGSGRSLGRIQIAESSSTSAEAGAVLSLPGDNLRLEKGITFNFLLNQSASAGTTKPQ